MKTPPLLIIVFTLGLTAILLSPLTHGRFWIIDDHEIIAADYDFKTGHGSFLEKTLTLLKKTELGNWEETQRYRPIYYIARTIKTITFGDNPLPYFILNMLYFSLAFSLIGLTIGRKFGWFITLPFLTMLASLRLHNDLWARLGPAEIDAFLYTAIFAHYCLKLENKKSWPIACISAAFAIGCKENFILLLFPLAITWIYGVNRSLLSRYSLIWFLVPAATAIPVAIVISRAITGNKDIYLQGTSTAKIFSLLPNFFTSLPFLTAMACCLSLIAISLYSQCSASLEVNTKKQSEYIQSKDIIICALILISLLVVLAGNFLFYRGSPNTSSRYAFPYTMIPPAMGVCILYPIRSFLGLAYSKYKLIIVCIVALSSYPLANGIKKIFNNIRNHISVTEEFHSVVQQTKGYKKIYLINADSIMRSYEPYYSMLAFSRAQSLPPVYYFPIFSQNVTDLDEYLAAQIRSNILLDPKEYPLNTDVLLLEARGMRLRKIEHQSDERDFDELLFSNQDLRYTHNREALSLSQKTKCYIPTNNAKIYGLEILPIEADVLKQWDIYINDTLINKEEYIFHKNSFAIRLTDKIRCSAAFPQLPTITFVPTDPSTTSPLNIKSIKILRH